MGSITEAEAKTFIAARHAGDEETMERTAHLALSNGVRIGAHPSYPDRENFGRLELPMSEEEIAQTVYGAADVEYSDRAKKKLAQFYDWGYGGHPVCVAKTQYSLSDNPKLPGAPTGWTLHISDMRLSAGAGFLVAVSGSMMLMPGLPKDPRAFEINVDEEGEIAGPL